jgi:integrase/recombinase XerC
VKDKSYRATRLGQEVGHYVRWMRNEYGATESTLRDYEAILARLALAYPDHELAAFEPPEGTQLLRAFIDTGWGDRSARTRKKVRSVLMSFFRWANGEFKLRGNPVEAIRSPKLRDPERPTLSLEDAAQLVNGQAEARDRLALTLMLTLALRKSEVRRIQFKHFDLGRRRLRVIGKGGKIIDVPLPTEELRLAIESLIREEKPEPNEYLLYPQRRGPIMRPGDHGFTPGAPVRVIWKDRRKSLDESGMQRWWKARISEAGIPYVNMHAARHTAITDFLRKTGNLKLAQQLARHSDISTTANIYVHTDDADLEEAMRRVHEPSS